MGIFKKKMSKMITQASFRDEAVASKIFIYKHILSITGEEILLMNYIIAKKSHGGL